MKWDREPNSRRFWASGYPINSDKSRKLDTGVSRLRFFFEHLLLTPQLRINNFNPLVFYFLMLKSFPLWLVLWLIGAVACQSPQHEASLKTMVMENQNDMAVLATATFGSGCFWCSEAVFELINGVEEVESGYMGGHVLNPTYREVCTGTTGHAEVIQIRYNPAVITYEELLELFFTSHDPTTLNRQGNDVGPQYRSVIFYHDEIQKSSAINWISALNNKKALSGTVVTEVTQASTFFKAENYHQDYFRLNGHEPYCTFVINPKVEKVKNVFRQKLK